MKKMLLILALGLLAGCTKSPTGSAASQPANKPKTYSTDDVDHELQAAGVELGGTQEDVQAFINTHPAYQVCQSSEVGFIAVMRNQRIDPKVDDEYVVIAYREGKISNVEVGPPQFSVGNVASYCH